MKIWPSLLLGLALGLGAAAPAGAADLGDGGWSMKDGYGDAPQRARWYLRGDVGYALHDDPDITLGGDDFSASGSSIDDTWTIGGGVGLYFSPSFRGDITVDYRNDAEVDGVFDFGAGEASGGVDLSSTVVLANLYYDFNRGSRFTPYIGVGLGVTSNQTHDGTAVTECGCTYTFGSETETDFAAAFMVGAAIDLAGERSYGSIKDGMGDGNIATPEHRGLKLDLGYRFLYLGDATTGAVLDDGGAVVTESADIEDIHAHEFRVGLRYDIW